MIHPNTTFEVAINHIAADPDRFGRLRPTILFDATQNHQNHYQQQTQLNNFDELNKRNYAVGDLVELRFFGAHPQLGRILRPASRDNREPFNAALTYCRHCQQPLVQRYGQLHCPGENCPLTAFARLLHACAPSVLDLPFGRDTLEYLVWGDELVTTFASLFFLEPEHFRQNGLHDYADIDVIVGAVRNRLDQLHGRGYSETVQRIAQLRFLDALSIPGLHSKNLRRMTETLANRAWHWGELASVLTDTTALCQFDIPISDVRAITTHARERIMELDSIARDF